MTVITHKNDTIATVEVKDIKYNVTIRHLNKGRHISIEKRSKALGLCTEKIYLEIPDWEIIKPLVEEALKEDEIMRRVLAQYEMGEI